MSAVEAAKEPVKLFLDGATEPFKIALPPVRFRFSTLHLADGPHELRIEASNGLAPPTTRVVPFSVRNGVALSVTGLKADQTIGGQVEMIINAFAGNTEVDFEPSRAETPQPVPTWAWVLLLLTGAWTMFYVANPPPARADFVPHIEGPHLGAQLYDDTCARCHGTQGLGLRAASESGFFRVPALRNATNMAVAESPAALLSKVVVGAAGTQMPAWGPQSSVSEIVAVVNHVRSAWGHDASLVDLRHRIPPQDIDTFENQVFTAIKAKDAVALAQVAWAEGARPVLFRRGDDSGGTIGRKAVTQRWAEYFEAQCDGAVTALQFREVRYDYAPETVDQEGAVVIAVGRLYQASRTHEGNPVSERGRFIRIYRRKKGKWQIALDFADVPFRVGCGPEPERAAPPPKVPVAPVDLGAPLGFKEVQAMLLSIDKDARGAPHANFWSLPYDEFVNQVFDYELPQGEATVRMVVPYHSDKSNLIRSLRDGQTLICCMNGKQFEVPVRRMPVGADPLSELQILKLAGWVDEGCPEIAGQQSTQEKRDPDSLLCGSTGSDAPAQPVAPPSDAPAGGFPAPDAPAGGFPPPDAPAGGFPPPDAPGKKK